MCEFRPTAVFKARKAPGSIKLVSQQLMKAVFYLMTSSAHITCFNFNCNLFMQRKRIKTSEDYLDSSDDDSVIMHYQALSELGNSKEVKFWKSRYKLM